MEQHFAQAKWMRNPGLDGLMMMLPDDDIPGLRLPFAKPQTPLHPGYDVVFTPIAVIPGRERRRR